MALSPLQRKLTRHALAAVAVLCLVFTSASLLLTLEAGTLQLDGDYPTGPARLILSRLALVRFKGIIASGNDEDPSASYQVTLLWFLNAFGWEWPSASWDLSCGIVHNINGLLPGAALTLPADLGQTAARMQLPMSDWQCLSSNHANGGNGICHNPFLAAWDAEDLTPISFSTAPALWLFYFTGIVLFAILLQEIGIRWLPALISCYCPSFMSRNGLCPCLKTDEKLTPEVRTRMRTWYLVLLAISYTAASTVLTLKGLALVQFLRRMDSKIGGMDPQLGTTYIKLSAFTLIAILLSVLFLRVRRYLEQKKSWMEQQGVDSTTLTEPAAKPTDEEEATQDLLI
ncbi:unnamed protein product [Clonostachys byssicola]|uniref:Uncharacterized protein n=1 Tax=Clonostachys byssicola TaxID=160290 RepID=A0A9N9V019_9HYPO|nr:unnamed protein product [Clonostachys byssicola]